MKHCPIMGSEHKQYLVRLSPQVVQCLAEGCGKPFMDVLPDAERKGWKPRDADQLPAPEGDEINVADVTYFVEDDRTGRRILWNRNTPMTTTTGGTNG